MHAEVRLDSEGVLSKRSMPDNKKIFPGEITIVAAPGDWIGGEKSMKLPVGWAMFNSYPVKGKEDISEEEYSVKVTYDPPIICLRRKKAPWG